jgi:microcystin degradation protein MlrC
MAARVRVDALSDGAVVYEGEMYGGGVAQVGASAALRILADGCDIVVAVSSVRNQCLDRGYFRFLGLEPETACILAVKSTVHHRAEFDPICEASLAVCVPGALASDLTRPAYRHLLPGVRLGPGGPEFGRER